MYYKMSFSQRCQKPFYGIYGTTLFALQGGECHNKVQTPAGETITYEYKKPLPEDIDPARCTQKVSEISRVRLSIGA